MKNIILTTIFALLYTITYAQDIPDNKVNSEVESPRMETFKLSNKGTHGVYIGVGGGYANFDSYGFATLNARIAYVIDQKFEIGFAGQSFHNYASFPQNDGLDGTIAGGVGGFHLKGIYFGRRRIHLSTPLFLGAGGVALIAHNSNDFFDDFDPELVKASPIFVAEPGVNVEFNISKVLGLEIGAKYRFSHQTNLVANRLNNMDGLMLGATLKVGYFDFGGRNKKSRSRKAAETEKFPEEEGYRSY